MKATRLMAAMLGVAAAAGMFESAFRWAKGNHYEAKAKRNPESFKYLKRSTGTFKQNKRRGL
jgi:hypothetical protein